MNQIQRKALQVKMYAAMALFEIVSGAAALWMMMGMLLLPDHVIREEASSANESPVNSRAYQWHMQAFRAAVRFDREINGNRFWL